jgi:hypothetical protein
VSTLLGVLQTSGKGGNELFVFDDALVRASTGLGAALLGAIDSSTTEGAEALKRAVTGKGLADKGPEQLLAQSRTNTVVWTRDLQGAVLAQGRWPSTGLRRLTLTLKDGSTVEHSWPGDGATRPLNHDAYAVALLTSALPDLLDVRLKQR